MSTFTITSPPRRKGKLSTDMSAPLPLSYTEAVRRAIELREKGSEWTWPTIATVIAEYHGFKRCPEWWRDQLRGRVTPRPRGGALGSSGSRRHG